MLQKFREGIQSNMSKLELIIAEYVSNAEVHASKCEELITEQGLADALEYCQNHKIDPPQCSLTAKSSNAVNLRANAKRMLSEIKWWSRRLEIKAVQDFEMAKIKSGQTSSFISEEAYEYQQNKRVK